MAVARDQGALRSPLRASSPQPVPEQPGQHTSELTAQTEDATAGCPRTEAGQYATPVGRPKKNSRPE
jgi:hypothetical protein